MRGSPLHDGAVIINGDQIFSAACVLPLSSNPNVSLSLGTRHRAAIGMTEDTDAVVLVVSEERRHHLDRARRGSAARAGALGSSVDAAESAGIGTASQEAVGSQR